ncbi:MAG: PAS domain S-box protein [Stygiobacter sp.]|nr:MAG: PAS domain S-box protein [Stygiobacter sp.]
MENKLHILILEDVPSDAELAEFELKTELNDFVTKIVDNEKDFIKELSEFNPNLIISDYRLPNFTGLSALKITLEKSRYIPFIIYTASINEETAVECMKAGADDYVIKEHIRRLGIAAINAIERKKSEKEHHQLIQSTKESEVLLKSAQVIGEFGYWELDLIKHKSVWSENTYRIFGYEPFEIEIDLEFFRSRVHPEDIQMIKQSHEEILEERMPMDYDFRIICKDGSIRWLNNKIKPAFENGNLVKLLGTNHDITERKKIDLELKRYKERLEDIVEEKTKELRWSEEKFRVLTEYSKDVVIRFNRDLRVQYINPAAEILIGSPVEGCIGKTLKELGFTDDLIPFAETTLEKVFNTKEESRIEFKYPNERWIDLIIIPEIKTNGEVSSVFVSGRDVTKLKEYEAKLQIAIDKEKKLNELKSKFISTASHEFRTPLATILSSAQMIQKFSKIWDETELTGHFDTINESIKYIVELMDEVLLISKAETGAMKIQLGNVELESIMQKFIDESKSLIKKELKIKYNNKAYEKEIVIDKKMFHQIVSNLLSNAAKYSNEGSEVLIETDIKKNKLYLKIEDKGIGIEKEELPHIFDPFFRTKNAMHIEGTGLGLNIVKSIVEVLNGKIDVKSEINKGTSFYVEIPITKINT